MAGNLPSCLNMDGRLSTTEQKPARVLLVIDAEAAHYESVRALLEQQGHIVWEPPRPYASTAVLAAAKADPPSRIVADTSAAAVRLLRRLLSEMPQLQPRCLVLYDDDADAMDHLIADTLGVRMARATSLR